MECWEWQVAKTKTGHGVFSIKGKWIGAHVVSFLIKNGYKPQYPNLVMHDCENPSCVNPSHLLEGTIKQNGNYPGCVEKCRKNIKDREWFGSKGENHPRWGMKHSEETKAKLSAAAKKRGGWHKGFKRSEKTKQKLRELFRGENSPNAKLTESQVIEIFKMPGKYAKIAKLYSIDPSMISVIKNRKRWTHITNSLPDELKGRR